MVRKIVRKGRRVFSIEPNKVAYTMFARNYVKHLMTSLVKISHQQQQQNFQKLVRFEVDMAMAQSASEFSWGIALKKKLLQRDDQQEVLGNGSENGFDFSLQTMKKISHKNLGNEEEDHHEDEEEEEEEEEEDHHEEEEEEKKEEEEEKEMENGLMKLRKIIPGGDDFSIGGNNLDEEDDLLKQTESYVKCLELQVNVLRGLVETNTFF
ncbi:transcription factor bHLH146 [Cucumis melo]|uniref:Transcription factor bHLH146 n=1 Tax=Cucumis melo TaxID=3656 RepID=A0ABM3KUB5_CUCME|nr:transcription factor bHLH146 [Cucumis melo]